MPADGGETRQSAQPSITGGFWMWFGVVSGIGAWMVHITVLAAIVQFTCNAGPAWLWASHATTVATAAVTACGMLMCVRMIRRAGADEAAGNLAGSVNFLGRFGLITGGLSLAVILLEGSFVLFIDPCA